MRMIQIKMIKYKGSPTRLSSTWKHKCQHYKTMWHRGLIGVISRMSKLFKNFESIWTSSLFRILRPFRSSKVNWLTLQRKLVKVLLKMMTILVTLRNFKNWSIKVSFFLKRFRWNRLKTKKNLLKVFSSFVKTSKSSTKRVTQSKLFSIKTLRETKNAWLSNRKLRKRPTMQLKKSIRSCKKLYKLTKKFKGS